jgi:hypothetical protein
VGNNKTISNNHDDNDTSTITSSTGRGGGVVHFFSAPPSPTHTPGSDYIVNVGAAACPTPCSANVHPAVLTAQSPAAAAAAGNANGAAVGIQMTNISSSSSLSSLVSSPTTISPSIATTVVSPITPAVAVGGGVHFGIPHPILLNASAPVTATHPLHLAPPISPLHTNAFQRARGFTNAVSNWKHSAPLGFLTSRTPSEASLQVSPIAMGIVPNSTPTTPLLAPIAPASMIHGGGSGTVPGTPQPQRLVTATTSSAELIDLRVKHRFLLRLMKAVHAFGCATHRTESLMRHACDALGLKGEFCVFPTLIIGSTLHRPTRLPLKRLIFYM